MKTAWVQTHEIPTVCNFFFHFFFFSSSSPSPGVSDARGRKILALVLVLLENMNSTPFCDLSLHMSAQTSNGSNRTEIAQALGHAQDDIVTFTRKGTLKVHPLRGPALRLASARDILRSTARACADQHRRPALRAAHLRSK